MSSTIKGNGNGITKSESFPQAMEDTRHLVGNARSMNKSPNKPRYSASSSNMMRSRQWKVNPIGRSLNHTTHLDEAESSKLGCYRGTEDKESNSVIGKKHRSNSWTEDWRWLKTPRLGHSSINNSHELNMDLTRMGS